jgi:hypothetical protein
MLPHEILDAMLPVVKPRGQTKAMDRVDELTDGRRTAQPRTSPLLTDLELSTVAIDTACNSTPEDRVGCADRLHLLRLRLRVMSRR